MASINTKKAATPRVTHEGGKASAMSAEQALRRSLFSCMLWESEFYEDGDTIAKRIQKLVPTIRAERVKEIAIEAREQMKLRHVPLLVVYAMTKVESHKGLVAETLERVIQRPDELTEFVAIYFKDGGRRGLSAQVKKGLARAFTKFNEYSLAKYDKDGEVKLRDVLFLCHAKPKDGRQKFDKHLRKASEENRKKNEAAGKRRYTEMVLHPGEELFRKVVERKLAIPNTWETRLSSGENKKTVWTELISEGALGALAVLKNLRGMQEAGVEDPMIRLAIDSMDVSRVLPFRFVAAAKFAPRFEQELENAMFRCTAGMTKLRGTTVLLVDVSGSMDDKISGKSDMQRIDAASALAMILREIGERVVVVTFSSQIVEVAPRRGFALREAIVKSQSHSSTYLGAAVSYVNEGKAGKWDRMVVFTDEQSSDSVPAPKGKGYLINVASAKNGVGYGPWIHLDGFSEAVVAYIAALEESDL